MSEFLTRRRFLAETGTMAAGLALADHRLIRHALADESLPASLVAIARDEALLDGVGGKHAQLLTKLLDGAMQQITGAVEPEAAWRTVFQPGNRVGIKVNTLGLSTNPAVARILARHQSA